MLPDAAAFAARWAEDWNSLDLDRILSHYSPGIVFRSPFAARMLPGNDGSVRGLDELRHYWSTALGLRATRLHFEVLEVFTGTDTLVIRYRTEFGAVVCELLTFGEDGLVVEGRGTYEPQLLDTLG